MKEIIIVTKFLTNGGAERVLSELIAEWVKNDCKVSVVQIRPECFEDTYELPSGVEIIDLEYKTQSRFLRRLIQTRKLIGLLHERENATVLAMPTPAIPVVAMAKPFIKNRVVFAERNDPNSSPPHLYQKLIRDQMYKLADACIFQTPDAKAHFSKMVQKKGVIIPNPVNPNIPEPFEGNRRKAIVSVCRLHVQKNIPMTLYAFKKFVQEFPDYTLEIYGRGEDEEKIADLINELGLMDKVFLMGFTHNVYEKIRDATMYVSSSDNEGISNSMLEALAMGIPTICTDCPIGGAKMMINSGENGLLVPIRDIESLYQAMKMLAGNSNIAFNLSNNALKIKEEYPVTKIAETWLETICNNQGQLL